MSWGRAMALDGVLSVPEPTPAARRSVTDEGAAVRWLLVATALGFLTLFLFVPLAAVFYEALRKGWRAYFAAVAEPPVRGIERILSRAAERATEADVRYAGLVLPAEAFELTLAGAVLVDVRTRAEWELVGRVPGSVLVEWQRYPDGAANRGFFAELDVHASHEDVVLFLCRSARRSHLAAEAAAARGYSRAFNILEGFEGDLDAVRRRGTLGGWRSAGLPWVQS